jgi:hypothetical protein
MIMDPYHRKYPYYAPRASSNARTHLNVPEKTTMLIRQADLAYGLPRYDKTRVNAEPAPENEPSANPRKRRCGKDAAELSDLDDDDNVAPTNAEVRAGTALRGTRRRHKAAESGNIASEDAKIETEKVTDPGYMLGYIDPGARRRRRGQRPRQAPPAPLPGTETVPMPALGQDMIGPILHWRLPSVNGYGQLDIPAFWEDVPEPITGWPRSELVPLPKMQRGSERPGIGGAGSVGGGETAGVLGVANDKAQQHSRTV